MAKWLTDPSHDAERAKGATRSCLRQSSGNASAAGSRRLRTETDAIDRLATIGWDAYQDSRNAPVTRNAGSGFTDRIARADVTPCFSSRG